MNLRIQVVSWMVLFTTIIAAAQQQATDVKYVADTVIVQAEGSYELDPDLATITFNVSDQEKDFKQAYTKASQSMHNIVDIAEKNGLGNSDIQTGVLTMTPSYEVDRHKKAKSYFVQGQVVLKVTDFSKVGMIVDDAIQDGIADFRSLTYSLRDEESAKEKAVAQAMQRAAGRARAALEQNHQSLGAVRYVNLEVTNLVSAIEVRSTNSLVATEVESGSTGGGIFGRAKVAPPPPPPPVQPEKIAVNATVQCVFGIGK